MDPLEKRVQERMTLEARQLRSEQMTLGKRKQAALKDAEKAHKASTALFAALEKGGTPTKAVAAAGTAALKTLAKSARTAITVNERLAANAATLTALDDPAERKRRVEAAQALGVTDKPLSGVEAAEMVLVRRGKATHVTDLTREVLETGVVRLTGKTPEQTMSAYLAKEAGKPEGRFVRVAPGVFDLRTKTAA